MSVLLMWCQNIQIFGLSLNKGGCWELNRQSLSWLSIFCFYLELENDPDLHDATLSIDMTVPCWPVQWFFSLFQGFQSFPSLGNFLPCLQRTWGPAGSTEILTCLFGWFGGRLSHWPLFSNNGYRQMSLRFQTKILKHT